MLNSANFVAVSRNPSCSVLLFFRTRSSSRRGFVLRSYNQFFISHFMASSSSSSSKIVVEYARSSRSSCKKCRGTIAFSNLRLGLVSRDPRGYDTTRWHHLHCFPVDSQPIGSAEEINGFPLLKSSDQEALKNLVASCRQLQAEDIGGKDGAETSDKDARKDLKVRKADESGFEEFEGSRSKKPKVRKADESGVEEIERSSSKKPKAELEIAFSSADIKNKYKDATLMPKWKALQTIIFLERDEGLHDSSKIAAFDFDGCLVKTSVKRIGPDAWSLLYPSIPGKLKSLYDDGYKLVIFTNESNIERWKNKRQVAVDSKIGRLNSFIELVNVPIQVFIACGLGKSGGQPEDLFRKPKIGMWRIMEQQFNSGIAIDMDKSFYVGDAARRPNDHSDADVKFAQAIGLKFYVPEDFFTA